MLFKRILLCFCRFSRCLCPWNGVQQQIWHESSTPGST